MFISLIFGCISHGLDIALTTFFYLWLPSMIQAHVLLLHFIFMLCRLCGFEIIPPKPTYSYIKTRLRHYYKIARRIFVPKRSRRRPRLKKRFVKFRRRRLPFHVVIRCRRRTSVHLPTLDGRRVPTLRSRRHRCWRRRKVNSKLRHRIRRVVNHEFFLNLRGQSLPSPISTPYSDEKLAEFCERQDFLAPLKLF